MQTGTDKRQSSETYRIGIKGLVQGVGFRPFVFRVAVEYGLTGWVENRNDGVLVQVSGSHRQVDNFREGLLTRAPAAASIELFETEKIPFESYESFEIRESRNLSESITEISPDIAVCRECLHDLKNQPHRISYPLINCTHCGPRFSIIRDLPYDRVHTTMSDFELCPTCASEYNDLYDRRFHAQPVACNHCGPVYRLEYGDRITEDIQEILASCATLLSGNSLLAIKGTGGFHLVCNAFNEEGVEKLRKMKGRDGKPFALMFRSLEEARSYVEIGKTEETWLNSWRRPIVLLRKKEGFPPGLPTGWPLWGSCCLTCPFITSCLKSLKLLLWL